MKTKLLPMVCCMLLTCHFINSNAQANKTLSNLISPTAVNQSLLPGADNTINLGSNGQRWKNLYLGNALYLKGNISMHSPGFGNFFVGNNTGNISVTGSYNTGTGQYALNLLTSASYNTANGYSSLYFDSTGSENTATGAFSLYSNRRGYFNTAIGVSSLYSNVTGYKNTAIGEASLYHNITGINNTATGYLSLYSNTIGHYNTADGYYSLYSNTSGQHNTANGYYSMNSNTTGSNNTAIGYYSMHSSITGSENTALGFDADVSNGNLTNATAIGFNAIVDASNKVRIGNTSVTSIGGQVEWTTPSDGRYKKDIKENVQGLAFINSLRPITYTVNVQGLNEYYNKGRKQLSNNAVSANEEAANAEMKKSEDEASNIVYNGFIAQEVEEAAKKLNYEFSGVDKPQTEDGLYGLRYSDFVVPLVKAVQELSHQNDELKKENIQMKSEIGNLKSEIIELKSITLSGNSLTTNLSDVSLAQNTPNPFVNTTIINYSLPQKFTTAQILITDKNGKQLKQLNISGSGKGSLNVNAATLAAGAYNYSLIVDGELISSKQMEHFK